jgi:transglutaminase-like putative cysteine protease
MLHAPELAHDRGPLLAVTIEREPFDPAVTFVPSETVAFVPLDAPAPGAPSLRYVAYVARVFDEGELMAPAERAHHLALPAGMPSRVGALAHAWADPEATPEAKARAIEQHLKKELGYGLASSSRGAEQPVDHFLFESKRGHCELFASAMAIMLREVGIPSRNVTGFVGGTYNRFGGYYVVRQGEAHDWVEAYIDGPKAGWRTFDPTPGAPLVAPDSGMLASSRDLGDVFARRWSSAVVSYDRRAQSSIVDVLRLPSALLIGAGVIILLALAVRRGGSRTAAGAGPTHRGDSQASAASSAATALYGSLEAALVVKGVVRDRSRPPLAHAQHLLEQRHPLAHDVIALTRLYLEARFGGHPLSPDARREFERGIQRVKVWERAAG